MRTTRLLAAAGALWLCAFAAVAADIKPAIVYSVPVRL